MPREDGGETLSTHTGSPGDQAAVERMGGGEEGEEEKRYTEGSVVDYCGGKALWGYWKLGYVSICVDFLWRRY